MNIEKLQRLFATLRYLKPIQIRYRLYYLLRKKLRKITRFSYVLRKDSQSVRLVLAESIPSYPSLDVEAEKLHFRFLNLPVTFKKGQIDWNYAGNGKLWTYNLNYFEFLMQEEMEAEIGEELIYHYIRNLHQIKDGLEPFPISLRGINWIKFFTKFDIKNRKIDDALYAQYYILADNLEYQLLGNHLLENGFSLLFGAYYFKDEYLYRKACDILYTELEEQILSDGAHFELSPMYHQLMLYRLLDCLNLVMHNDAFERSKLEKYLRTKAEKMAGWLAMMTYENGEVPHFNDTADGIAPNSAELFEYAENLGVSCPQKRSLSESGYRRFSSDTYLCFVDVGNIGPDYIPGHAHSDTFNFELQVKSRPFIVDTGVSTYEDNEVRHFERSTKAHNTVQIEDFEQSEIWSSFRVAQRAYILSLQEEERKITATHDGYRKLGLYHTRSFEFKKGGLRIIDRVAGNRQNRYRCYAYLHFHPSTEYVQIKDSQIFTNLAEISFKGSKKIQIDDFIFAEGFNKTTKAKMAVVSFEKDLETLIDILL